MCTYGSLVLTEMDLRLARLSCSVGDATLQILIFSTLEVGMYVVFFFHLLIHALCFKMGPWWLDSDHVVSG